MDGLSRQAAERNVPVETTLQDLATTAAVQPEPTKGNNAEVLRDAMTHGLRHGISGEGFDAIAAQHQGHRL
jgi:hypothetical protein